MATTSDWAGHDLSPAPHVTSRSDPVFPAVRPHAPHSRGPTWMGDVGSTASLLPYPRVATSIGVEYPTLTATHCTIAVVDVEGFGDYSRNNTNQVRIRRGLYGAMQSAFDAAGIPWDGCRREDRGDGVLILAPADVPKTLFADRLPGTLADALITHNKCHPVEEQIRLRLALHAGEILHDEHGVTSSSINHTFRILDADALKSMLAASHGVLAVIGSAWFYDDVIRHSDWSQANSYVAVDIVNKETKARAWIRVVGSRRTRRRDSEGAFPLGQRRRQAK